MSTNLYFKSNVVWLVNITPKKADVEAEIRRLIASCSHIRQEKPFQVNKMSTNLYFKSNVVWLVNITPKKADVEAEIRRLE
ncbi:hypothetical protein P8452_51375 [Trifolium repens]|nr:hypothetical protein P8452_51375 [Trifolium repens]